MKLTTRRYLVTISVDDDVAGVLPDARADELLEALTNGQVPAWAWSIDFVDELLMPASAVRTPAIAAPLEPLAGIAQFQAEDR